MDCWIKVLYHQGVCSTQVLLCDLLRSQVRVIQVLKEMVSLNVLLSSSLKYFKI